MHADEKFRPSLVGIGRDWTPTACQEYVSTFAVAKSLIECVIVP